MLLLIDSLLLFNGRAVIRTAAAYPRRRTDGCDEHISCDHKDAHEGTPINFPTQQSLDVAVFRCGRAQPTYKQSEMVNW
jgi:hypothetical protein